jgi:hypothetical protein
VIPREGVESLVVVHDPFLTDPAEVIPREGVEREGKRDHLLLPVLVIPREGVERSRRAYSRRSWGLTCDPERGS